MTSEVVNEGRDSGANKREHVGRYGGNNTFRRGQRADVYPLFCGLLQHALDGLGNPYTQMLGFPQASIEHCAAPSQDTCLPSPEACPSDIGAADAVT